MIDFDPLKLDPYKITEIIPVYDFKGSKGHFNLKFGVTKKKSFNIKFAAVMEYRVQQDESLYSFLKTKYSENDRSLSEAIQDLYDIGFPVDDWVKDYLHHVMDTNEKFITMMKILGAITSFDEDDREDNSEEPLI